jgi:hypothetical protein
MLIRCHTGKNKDFYSKQNNTDDAEILNLLAEQKIQV